MRCQKNKMFDFEESSLMYYSNFTQYFCKENILRDAKQSSLRWDSFLKVIFNLAKIILSEWCFWMYMYLFCGEKSFSFWTLCSVMQWVFFWKKWRLENYLNSILSIESFLVKLRIKKTDFMWISFGFVEKITYRW